MTKIIQNFAFFLIFLIMFMAEGVSSTEKAECNISYKNLHISGNLFESNLTFSLSKGWKLAKDPQISVLKSENVQNYSVQRVKKIDETTYEVKFNVTILSANNNGNVVLSIDIPMCSDICTIVSKKLSILYDAHEALPQSAQNKNQDSNNFLLILLFAFLGGLILNVMPCVLPVVGMKLKSFAVVNKKTAMIGTIVGNYLTFAGFALFLASLKLGGEQIGWGMHFQNPYFLKVVVIFLFLLALYAFEIISIPISMQFSSEKKQIFLENVVSSVIASIVAIPCTAPMLGTAAAFAVQGTIAELFVVFFAIATGFSAPYIIMAFFAPKISVMPKTIFTGRIAERLKTLVNCGVLITLIWIMSILLHHIGCIGIIICTILMIFSASLFYRKKHNALAVIFLFPIMFLSKSELEELKPNFFGAISDSEIVWTEYKHGCKQSIMQIMNEEFKKDHVIILNISADWCLTCKYNEINVFGKKEVQQLIKENDIMCIKGDITSRDDSLMKFINDHGRAGIPFTIVFGPNAKDGILLPEIFTPDNLKDAVAKASEKISKTDF